MSDTTDRLSRARSEMEAAHARLLKAEADYNDTAPWVSGVGKLIRATAEHSRALRELFLASLEAPEAKPAEPPSAEPPKRYAYNADGPAYRRLRAQMVARSMHGAVGAIDRLEAFAADEADVRLVAGLLVEVLGERETAASLLRNVEG